jgi:hypothetical protein
MEINQILEGIERVIGQAHALATTMIIMMTETTAKTVKM